MQENFKRYGFVSTLDALCAEVEKNMPSKPSMRELVPNQKHTRNIIGLYSILDDVEGMGDSDVFFRYFRFLHEVTRAIKMEYGYTNIEYKSLMIVKLLAGQDIADHIDEAGIYKYAHRVHVPIVTNNGCIFTINGEEGRMAAGEIVEINNTVPHWVVNGDEDRVHLIVDIMGVHNLFDAKSLDNPVPKQFYFEED